MTDPLASSCPNCGKPGRGLSACEHCGEFIGMTLALANDDDNEYGIDGYNSFLGEVQHRLIAMNLNPPKWPDTIRDLGDLDAALDSCTEWCADRLNEIARLNAATKE